MVAAFEKANPNIHIKTLAVPYNNLPDQDVTMAVGGRAPDIAQITYDWLPALAKFAAPVDGLMDKATLADYMPSLLKGDQVNGQQLALPWAPSPVAVYYNKQLLAKAHIANPPTSWKEMLTDATAIAALKTNAEGNKVYGIGVADKAVEPTGYYLLPWLWNYGGDIVDSKGKVDFDSPANTAAFQEIQHLFATDVAPKGVKQADMRNLFAHGQLGFEFDAELAVPIFDAGSPKGKAFRSDYGIIEVPGMTSAQGRTFYNEHDLMIFKSSKHQADAMKFINFLTGPDGMTVYNENDGNKLPARTSVASLPFYQQPANAFLQTFTKALASAQAKPIGPFGPKFVQAMITLATGVQRVESGTSPQQAVTQTAQQLNANLQ